MLCLYYRMYVCHYKTDILEPLDFRNGILTFTELPSLLVYFHL